MYRVAYDLITVSVCSRVNYLSASFIVYYGTEWLRHGVQLIVRMESEYCCHSAVFITFYSPDIVLSH